MADLLNEISNADSKGTLGPFVGPSNRDSVLAIWSTGFRTDLNQVGAMEQLLGECAAPLVIPLNRRNELAFDKNAKSAVYYFGDDEADGLAYEDMIRPIAKMFNEYLVFATVDTNEYPQMPETFGLDKKGLCLQVLQNGQVYHFDDELTAAGVQQFIQTVWGGKAQPCDGRSRSSSSHDKL